MRKDICRTLEPKGNHHEEQKEHEDQGQDSQGEGRQSSEEDNHQKVSGRPILLRDARGV
jgi:hypothetical protein